jgi:hypothetical protein
MAPLSLLLSLLFAAPAATDSIPLGAPADSVRARTPRVIRMFDQVLVRASPYDPRSTQTTQAVTKAQLDGLPVETLEGAFAARAGVVLEGEDLHVRG